MVGSRVRLWRGAAIVAAALGAAPAAADLRAGVDAWSAGDYAKAVGEWRPLANAGNGDAQFGMGQAYRLGRGVPADPIIARSWFEKAAAQGHKQAQTALGLILFQAGDRKAAMHWLKKAADRGDPRGQYVLAIAHFNGDGVPQDWARAYALMTRAAAQGMPAAASALAEMDKSMGPADRERGARLAQEIEAGGKAPSAAASAALARATGPRLRVEPAATRDGDVRVSAPAKVVKPSPTPNAVLATVTPRTPAIAPGGRWRVQLGAFGSPSEARSRWTAISSRIPALAGLEASYEPFGRYTRLRVGPLGGKGEADRLCASARSSGQDCFVVRP